MVKQITKTRSAFAPSMKIKVLTDRNVRESSVDGRIWGVVKPGMTVAKFLAAASKVKGANKRSLSGMLSHFVRSEFIKVVH